MMLGMPASNSTAMPIGRRSGRGQISVRKIAMPMPIGTAKCYAHRGRNGLRSRLEAADSAVA